MSGERIVGDAHEKKQSITTKWPISQIPCNKYIVWLRDAAVHHHFSTITNSAVFPLALVRFELWQYSVEE